MTDESTYQSFVYDLSQRLKEDALEVLAEWLERQPQADATDKAFYQGQLLAYYKVLSVMKNEAQGFLLEPDAFNWDGFDPETDFLSQW